MPADDVDITIDVEGLKKGRGSTARLRSPAGLAPDGARPKPGPANHRINRHHHRHRPARGQSNATAVRSGCANVRCRAYPIAAFIRHSSAESSTGAQPKVCVCLRTSDDPRCVTPSRSVVASRMTRRRTYVHRFRSSLLQRSLRHRLTWSVALLFGGRARCLSGLTATIVTRDACRCSGADAAAIDGPAG